MNLDFVPMSHCTEANVVKYFIPCFGSGVFVSLFFATFFDFPLVDVDLTLVGSTGSKVKILSDSQSGNTPRTTKIE